jgi:hypothetical protein
MLKRTTPQESGGDDLQTIPDPFEDAVRELIRMLDHEIGRRWMSLSLRLKIEEIEIEIGDRGTLQGAPG